MENIEEKLKTYRMRRRRQEQFREFRGIIKQSFMFGVKDKNETEHSDKPTGNIHDSDIDDNVLKQPDSDSELVPHNHVCEGILLSSEADIRHNVATRIPFNREDCILKYTFQVVYIAFWITLYIIAIEFQFGIVFLMFSALAAIYLNTRTGPKNRNEISAYSVFNKNCESIDGTLKAEHFEREICLR